jgi:hypothetical protein
LHSCMDTTARAAGMATVALIACRRSSIRIMALNM